MSHFVTLVSVYEENEIFDRMAPFEESTENPDYLDFTDMTEEVKQKYESETEQYVRLANGTICRDFDYELFSRKYTIKNGLVYQKNFGRLHHDKRTKKAKAIKVLPPKPVKEIYPTIEEYAEDYFCYSYNEGLKAYGYYCNPNAQWDWYQIGGRWPYELLVKSDIQDVIVPDLSWTWKDTPPKQVPDGYKWVAGAKKCDIEWGLMKELDANKKIASYNLYSEWFSTGKVPKDAHLTVITEKGIEQWGEILYYTGETLEEFLFRQHLGPEDKFLPLCYSFLSENDEWISEGDMGWWGMSTNNKDERTWNEEIAEFIESVPDDKFLVIVDCHI